MKPLSLVVLISGNGSNLQAIMDAIESQQLNATIACVISNKKDAFGLQRAQQANIQTQVLENQKGTPREVYDKKLMTVIDELAPQLIILAGFMRILSSGFVNHYKHRILNIHPSLLPKYPGLHTHKQVLAQGDKTHGCSIHVVTEELDGGPILAQAQLTVKKQDTLASLQSRIHELEHELYPLVIQWFAQDRLRVDQYKVVLDGNILQHDEKIIINKQK